MNSFLYNLKMVIVLVFMLGLFVIYPLGVFFGGVSIYYHIFDEQWWTWPIMFVWFVWLTALWFTLLDAVDKWS